jgi:hypothetical protein
VLYLEAKLESGFIWKPYKHKLGGKEKSKMTTNPETIYLLGAGFTKAFFPAAPLNKDLLEAIIGNGGNKIAEYRDKYQTDDIEQLLTQLDLNAISNKQLRKDRTTIEGEISTFFTKFRFSEFEDSIPEWFKNFAHKTLKENDAIVSLNYDCFLEGALDNLGEWSPNEGYARVRTFPTNSIPDNIKHIKIYKIHGSENFVESSVIGKNSSQTAIGFNINEAIYPRSGANSHLCGGAKDPRPYIIAPSFVKIPHVDIAAMMLELLDISQTAKNLIIVGCGMRPEDSFLWLLLTRFLNKILEKRKRFIILSPSADEIWRRVSKYWVGDICNFSDVTIIPCGLEHGVETVGDSLR